MVNNKIIFVRVTEDQHERIKNNAFAKGFKTVAGYVRALTLEKDMIFEQKFNEIYDRLIRNN